MNRYLFDISQIRMLEQQAMFKQHIPEFTLMERAGKSALDYLLARWPKAGRILVICGPGNNGGDGYVLAKEARKRGLTVHIKMLGAVDKFSPSTRKAFDECQAHSILIEPLDSNMTGDELCRQWLSEKYHVIVDAIFGIGLQREITGFYQHVIGAMNATGFPVLAIDVPSGIDADTGGLLGVAVRAQATITFIGFKRGLFTHDALDYCGEVGLADLGVNQENIALESVGCLLSSTLVNDQLPRRKRNAHKGNYGHVLIVGGNQGMVGAASLAAEGALRTGAGLVSVGTLPEHEGQINAKYPEIMCHGVTSENQLLPLLQRANVIVIGPGLGRNSWSKMVLLACMQSDLPMVIDADALNLLGSHPMCRDNWILTPHPGEAARLLGYENAREIQTNRFASIEKLAAQGGNWILKGGGTLIKCLGESINLCRFGNPGMASGGMGDALSGIIGSLVAQKISIKMAAKLGVLIHALAGDLAASRGERGLLASDLNEQLRTVVNPNN
jgi:hydroxyethylthiazole kinase-like uncharacterized protein yjeF